MRLPPTLPQDIYELIYMGIKIFDLVMDKLGKTKPVTKNSSADDIAELNEIFAEYRQSIEEQARQMEKALCENISRFASDLACAAQADHPLFQKYHIRLNCFQRKADTLSDRMEGVIMDRVSRVVSLDSPECSCVIRMLPGAEKDRAADNLLYSAIRQGQEAAAVRADKLSRELLAEYDDAVSEAIDQISIFATTMAREADAIISNANEGAAELTAARAESVRQAIILVASLLESEA